MISIASLLIPLTTFIIGLFGNAVFNSRKEDSRILKEQIEKLERLWRTALSYWTSDRLAPNSFGQEVEMRAIVFDVSIEYPEMSRIFGRDRFGSDYQTKLFDVVQHVMGGDFEVADRKADPSQALLSLQTISTLKLVIETRRRQLLSPNPLRWIDQFRE